MTEADEIDEVVKEFLVESYEGLDQVDRDLIALEQNGADEDVVARIFRYVHTIKGTCGFLGLAKLESVTHAGEGLLAKLRDGTLAAPPKALTPVLLALVDAIREMLGHLEASGAEGDADYAPLIAELTRLMSDEALTVAPPPVAAAVDANEPIVEAKAGGVADSSIRVDVVLLDRLMTLVGELVLARNQIVQHTNAATAPSLTAASQRLNLLTTELQEGVMKTRMQPIGNIWSKLPRVVRDLSVACGKEIRVEFQGQSTELDRTIVEAIKDPLTHIVRNAADHGIESPADRLALGKPVEGRLLLRAFHEGGQVNVEISDDGRGLDPARLKQKAVEKGIIALDQAARMTDREAFNLIFLPGFSTAASLTTISGRGVGMDVVRTNIEKIGGVVDLQSVLGQGTTLRIKIPLTLAIIPALIVTTRGERFAIPQVNLLELVRLEGERALARIEMIYGSPVYRLRGNLLPLVHLNDALGFTSNAWAATGGDVVNVVVLQADGTPFGLVVDSINDTEEIVVKPLSRLLKGISAFAGATIMGDGRVSLILDAVGLAHRAGVLGTGADRGKTKHVADSPADVPASQTLLVFSVGGDRRVAVPLCAIARLEEFNRNVVERSGMSEVVQYRDDILPLVRLGDALGYHGEAPPSEGDKLQVIVCLAAGQTIGLVVDRIVDIVESTAPVQRQTRRGPIDGATVIQGKVTELLNIERLLQDLSREFANSRFETFAEAAD